MFARVIISGDQRFNDRELLFQKCDFLMQGLQESGATIEIVCRGLSGLKDIDGELAAGADQLAQQFAEENELSLNVFPVDKGRYGKGAAGVANGAMSLYCSHAVIFFSGLEANTGDLIFQCQRHELNHRVIRYVAKSQQLTLIGTNS